VVIIHIIWDTNYQVTIAGAMDIELTWGTPGNTINWVTGYNNATLKLLYDFGTCEGCETPNNLVNNWQPSDVHFVSNGPNEEAIPEIYRNDGMNAYQWRVMSEACTPPIYFTGVFTEWKACQQNSCNNPPQDQASSQAAPQLVVEVSKSTNTYVHLSVTSIGLASDIVWYPR